MLHKTTSISLVVMAALLLAACTPPTPAGAVPTASPSGNLPNPASVFCNENGGELDIRTDASGGQVGVCVFADGSECDEWAFYRGECQPAGATPPAGLPNPASVFCEANGGTIDIRTDAAGGQYGQCIFADGSECDEWAFFRGQCGAGQAAVAVAADGCRVYRNPALGYSFHYPAEARLENADDPLHSLTVIGPLVGDDHWPMLYVAHPSDREEYRPPEGVDLSAWLVDHSLLAPAGETQPAEVRQSDVPIAGTTAIHTRFERSPQSYAYDKYFFARSEQLYTVVIMHTGDQEDWEVYNHFLESFAFED